MASTTEPMAAASSSTGITTSGTSDEPTVRTADVPAALVLAVGVAVVVLARLVGTWDGVGRLSLGAAPLIGRWESSLGLRATLPILVGGALVALAPVAADRLPWRALLVTAWTGSGLFALSLAVVDGREAVSAPLATGFEYRAVLDDIERLGVGRFADTFVAELPSYPTHVRGHPVAAPLFFHAHERLGLTGVEWSAALVILAGTSTAVSVAVALRVVAGEAIARRAVPYLVVPPALVWVATSADALVAGVVGAAVALVALATTRRDLIGDLLAAGAGVVAALALHLSYGAVLMLLPAGVIVLASRRWRILAVAAGGAAVVTGGFVALGFWWFDGLAATRVEYLAGAGGYRPFWYFATLGNPAALVLALGPASLVALARTRDRRLWLVTGGALAGVLVADLSGMSKGEVERIWLPFVPWLTAATAVLPVPTRRWWLGSQVVLAVVLQLTLESPW